MKYSIVTLYRRTGFLVQSFDDLEMAITALMLNVQRGGYCFFYDENYELMAYNIPENK